MKATPTSHFILNDKNPTKLGYNAVWARVLDKRFCMEVVRIEPYIGEFRVFDGLYDNKLLYTIGVTISFDAAFGVSHDDALIYSAMGLDIIDGKFKEKK